MRRVTSGLACGRAMLDVCVVSSVGICVASLDAKLIERGVAATPGSGMHTHELHRWCGTRS